MTVQALAPLVPMCEAWLCPTCGEWHGAADQGPRFATPRDPSWRSMGAQVAVVAAALGTPLMPWQRLVADVATEYRIDAAGRIRWHYPVVVLTVPRQCGKSTLLRAIKVHRALIRPGTKVFGTAQRGKDARDLWREIVERIAAGPLATGVSVLRGAGSETITFRNSSEIRPFAPTRDSLHGKTPHLVDIDEAWAFDAAKGADLLAAIRPAQITLPDRQLWIVSTAGDASSAFLREWVDTGRAAVDGAAPEEGGALAYFEWSAGADEPPYDPHTWRFHPALGYTIEYQDLAKEAEGAPLGLFERAYLNRWTVSAETVLNLDEWQALDAAGAQLAAPPAARDVTLAYEVAHDRMAASIYAAWVDAAGVPQIRLVKTAPGSAWLAREVVKLRTELAPRAIYADDGGPSRQITDELRRLLGDEAVTTLPFRDYATACGSFLARVHDKTIGHDGTDEIVGAIRRARLKPVGDQMAVDRRRSSGPVDALIAAIVAVWGATHAPAPVGKPFVHFG